MVKCDVAGCVRGLVHRGEWADPCPFCGGAGYVSWEALAERLGECVSTLRKLDRPHRKMRAKTAARLVEKIMEVV